MSSPLRLKIGCDFEYDVAVPSPALIQVAPRLDGNGRVLEETWNQGTGAPMERLHDLFGNPVRRTILEKGTVRLGYDALVELDGGADDAGLGAVQHRVEDLPPQTLPFLFASRYCLSDEQMGTAWELFGDTEPGWARVQAVCDWVHTNIGFQYGSSDATTTSKDVFERGRGVCRDFAQLFIGRLPRLNRRDALPTMG
jgi:transglutaminase-like putative cysteine protease